MKKIIYAFAAVLMALFTGCDSDRNDADVDSAVVGEWHLTSWSGVAPDGFDVYVEFVSDGSFNLWQQVETSTYECYSGTFTASSNVMTGIYSDGTEWGSTYSYTVSGSTMTLTTSEGTVSVYAKEAIPDDVKESTSSKAPANVPESRFL